MGTTEIERKDEVNGEKQGSTCCGCCCDMRRAVIIVNVFFLILSVISLILYLGTPTALTRNLDDDQLIADLEDAYVIDSIFVGVSIVVSILVIWGANQYKTWAVIVGIVWLVVQYISSVVWITIAYKDYDENTPIVNFVVSAIITCLFIYPHVGFVMEIKSGVMSKETYPREESSCCCV